VLQIFLGGIMNKRLILSAVIVSIVLIVIVVVAWILKDGVTVVIRNVGDESLQSVVVHVIGNSYSIGDINAGAVKTVKVVSEGDSHIVIEYGNQERLVVDTYFGKGYRGKNIYRCYIKRSC
jgi:hypothetical protein